MLYCLLLCCISLVALYPCAVIFRGAVAAVVRSSLLARAERSVLQYTPWSTTAVPTNSSKKWSRQINDDSSSIIVRMYNRIWFTLCHEQGTCYVPGTLYLVMVRVFENCCVPRVRTVQYSSIIPVFIHEVSCIRGYNADTYW